MNFTILSQKKSLYSTSRLVEEIEKDYKCTVVNPLRCYLAVSNDGAEIHYNGTRLPQTDILIPRIGASITDYGTSVVRQFESDKSILILNKARSIIESRDKFISLQMLASNDIPIPPTAIANSPDDINDLLRLIGGAPNIIKLIRGTQGDGVILADSKKSSVSTIQAFMSLKESIIVQKFIECGGEDIRCFVVGDKVVASMKRIANSEEFRSNCHKGSTTECVELTEDEKMMAVKASKVFGLDVSGVDIIRSEHSSFVIEVNSSPGLEGIEQTTGVNVAREIIDFAINSYHPTI